MNASETFARKPLHSVRLIALILWKSGNANRIVIFFHVLLQFINNCWCLKYHFPHKTISERSNASHLAYHKHSRYRFKKLRLQWLGPQMELLGKGSTFRAKWLDTTVTTDSRLPISTTWSDNQWQVFKRLQKYLWNNPTKNMHIFRPWNHRKAS